MRKTEFSIKEYYHIYNRGVDKRSIFEDKDDLLRFLFIIKEFNNIEPVGGLYKLETVLRRGSTSLEVRLVNIVAYCLNQNHYHFILEPLVDNGIQKFMHRIGTGYTMYFNEKYKRSGALFQGRYKSAHISSNEYLLHLSVYVNLNDKVHKNLNKEWMTALPISSFNEYTDSNFKNPLCNKEIILGQFKSLEKYKKYAIETLPDIINKKDDINMFID